MLNASAAFKTDSGKVFKEDVVIVPTIIDKSLSYIPWESDNNMPYRISRLLGSQETSRDIAIEQLIHNLFLNSSLSASPKQQWFSAKLFPNIDLANLSGFNEHRWANYLGLRSKAKEVEQRLAEEYISPEQLAVFRSEVMSAFTDISVSTSHHTRVIEQLWQFVVTALQGNQVPEQTLVTSLT